MSNDKTLDIETKIRERFNESVSALDGSTLSKITSVRNRVLDVSSEPTRNRFSWIPVGAVATFCAAIVLYSLVPQENMENKTFIDEVDIISELDLYENLEFYDWLEQHELPS